MDAIPTQLINPIPTQLMNPIQSQSINPIPTHGSHPNSINKSNSNPNQWIQSQSIDPTPTPIPFLPFSAPAPSALFSSILAPFLPKINKKRKKINLGMAPEESDSIDGERGWNSPGMELEFPRDFWDWESGILPPKKKKKKRKNFWIKIQQSGQSMD